MLRLGDYFAARYDYLTAFSDNSPCLTLLPLWILRVDYIAAIT